MKRAILPAGFRPLHRRQRRQPSSGKIAAGAPETGKVDLACAMRRRAARRNDANKSPVFRIATPVRTVLLAAAVCFMTGALCVTRAAAQNALPTNHVVGKAFDQVLGQTISVAWQAQNLRSGLRGLANSKRVSILIDRRIDPSTELSLQLRNVPLRDLLENVADELTLGVSRLESAVMIGPVATARRLRTDIEVTSSQLVRHPDKSRAGQLLERQSLVWSDLTSPRELLDTICQRYQLQIANPDRVPHDLWAAGALPSSNASEMLLVVLTQFDLGFEWSADLNAVRLVDLTEAPTIERQFTLRRGASASVLDDLRQALPDLTIEVRGRRVTARGLFEQVEQVQAALQPDRDQPGNKPKGPKVVTFTFEIRNAPLKDVMSRLEQQGGYKFEYNAEQFSKAGIRLEQPVSLKMKDASADELFTAMFDPVGLRHEIDGSTVRVRIKDRTDE